MKHYYKIYAKKADGGTFFLGEESANNEMDAKRQMAENQGQSLNDFIDDICNGDIVGLSAKKEACLCTECTKK